MCRVKARDGIKEVQSVEKATIGALRPYRARKGVLTVAEELLQWTYGFSGNLCKG